MKEERTANITEAIKAYFEDHPELFNDCIEELDDYNGYLMDDRRHDMDYLDDYLSNVKPSEILRLAFYGNDADSHNISAAFSTCRKYFYFNGYGNLVSTDRRDYSDYIDSYTIRTMCDNIDYIDSIHTDPELSELFTELKGTITEAA